MSRQAREREKMGSKSKKTDARQCATVFITVFFVGWSITVTVLLMRMAIMYTFDIVAQTRKDYSMKGAAKWAKREAEKDLEQAVEVWQVINASILGLVYREPEDYTNLAKVLAPAFDTLPQLYALQFAFSDRLSEVYVSKPKNALTNVSSVLMQSTAQECFLLGPSGCVEPLDPNLPGLSRPQWYQDAMTTVPLGAYLWADDPRIVVDISADGTRYFSPCVDLLFRITFPSYPSSGTGTKTQAVGRITLKLSALGGGRLVDQRLGKEGKIILVDGSGVVLASENPFDLLVATDSAVRFKKYMEVNSGIASKVQSALTQTSIAQMQDDSAKELIVVEPLVAPMQRFAVVVVAPSLSPFTDSALFVSSIVAVFMAPAPYVMALAAAFALFLLQCISSLRYVPPERDHPIRAAARANDRRISMRDIMPDSLLGKFSPRVSITLVYEPPPKEIEDSNEFNIPERRVGGRSERAALDLSASQALKLSASPPSSPGQPKRPKSPLDWSMVGSRESDDIEFKLLGKDKMKDAVRADKALQNARR
jgi:hypothetical protein